MKIDQDLQDMLEVMRPGEWYNFLNKWSDRIDAQLVETGVLEKAPGILGVKYRVPYSYPTPTEERGE